MSATLIIRKNQISWLPQAVLYEVVINRIAEQLRDIDTELAQMFYGAIEGSFILILTMLNQQQFSSVFEATRATQEKLLVEWMKNEIPNSQAYGICELKALLSLDKRSGHKVRETSGTLTIREGVVWQTEGWAYDLIIEYLALRLQRQHEPIAQCLLNGRVSAGNGLCDLSVLDEKEFQTFIGPIFDLKSRFINSRVRAGYAPEIETIFYPGIPALYEALRSDPRIADIQKIPIQWERTDDPDYPYQARINGYIWKIRMNDFPEEEMYTLIIHYEEIFHFSDWPQAWKR